MHHMITSSTTSYESTHWSYFRVKSHGLAYQMPRYPCIWCIVIVVSRKICLSCSSTNLHPLQMIWCAQRLQASQNTWLGDVLRTIKSIYSLLKNDTFLFLADCELYFVQRQEYQATSSDINEGWVYRELYSWCRPGALKLVSSELPLSTHLPTSQGWTAE